MYQSVNESDFIAAFEAIRPDNFSRPALRELFEYLEELERDLGEEVELDPIAICCDWVEYTAEELATDYSDRIDPDADDRTEGLVESLQDETLVIEVEHWENASTYLVLAF